MAQKEQPLSKLKYPLAMLLGAYSVQSRKAIRAQICNEASITPATLSEWENIKEDSARNISGVHLRTIARILGVTIESLLPVEETAEA